jgi:hypothetical protein
MTDDPATSSSEVNSSYSSSISVSSDSANNTQAMLGNEHSSNTNTRTIALNCGTSSKTLGIVQQNILGCQCLSISLFSALYFCITNDL